MIEPTGPQVFTRLEDVLQEVYAAAWRLDYAQLQADVRRMSAPDIVHPTILRHLQAYAGLLAELEDMQEGAERKLRGLPKS